MSRTTVSVCHGLKLIPMDQISMFARIRSKVVMRLLYDAIDADAIPGTVKTSTETENGIIKKKISYYRPDVSEKTLSRLEEFKALRLVAIYIDELGNKRVCGSPDCPLSLDYIVEGGAFGVTLSGEDLYHDGFLVD